MTYSGVFIFLETSRRSFISGLPNESHNPPANAPTFSVYMSDQKFIQLRVIGEGSFGRVYQGRLKYSGHIVAMKYINKFGKGKDTSFMDEVEVLRSLEHENIIQFLDYFETDSDFVVVTEFGQSDLSKLIENDKNLSEDEIHWISRQLIYALKYLHDKNITHRDLKPQNILIDSNGTIKLCDFGFARILDHNSGVMNSVKGTPLYMAPEIINGGTYDWRSDLWSFGALLYELFVGKPPFVAGSYGQLIHILNSAIVYYPDNMSAQFTSFLQGLLQKDPNKRFSWNTLLQHPFITEINTERQKNAKFKPGRKFEQRLNDLDDYISIAHTDMQLRDPALCKTQDDVLLKKRSELQNYLHKSQSSNNSLIRPSTLLDSGNNYGIGSGDIQLNRLQSSPFLGGALIKRRKKAFRKEGDEEDDEEYFDEDDFEDYEDEGFDINQNKQQLFKSQSQQEQEKLDAQKHAEEVALQLQQKMAQERERLLERAVVYRKPVSAIRRTKSCPSQLFIAITSQDLNEDFAYCAMLRDQPKKDRKHMARPWDEIITIVAAEDQILEQRKINRKKQERRPKSATAIMTKKKISEKDIKRMLELKEKERIKKELEKQKEIQRLKEIEIQQQREKEKLELQEKDKGKVKQVKQAFVPLVIHAPVLKINDDTLYDQNKTFGNTESIQKQEINQDQIQSSAQNGESDKTTESQNEEEDDQEDDEQEDEKELPSIGSLLPSQGSLDQIIDDTFAIHDQLPSNRGDKIVALMEQYSSIMQAPLLSDEDAFLQQKDLQKQKQKLLMKKQRRKKRRRLFRKLRQQRWFRYKHQQMNNFTYDIRTIRYGGMPYDYIWMELPTFISPLPSFCSYVRPTLDQFPLSLSPEQKQNSLIVASQSALCNPGQTKLSFKSCVDTFLVPSPPIPTWLSVRWGVMRWMSLKESIPAFLGLALSCSERAQRIVIPKIRSQMSIPSLTVDEMFAEINFVEKMNNIQISQTGIMTNDKAKVSSIQPQSQNSNLFSSSLFPHTAKLANQEATQNNLVNNASVGNLNLSYQYMQSNTKLKNSGISKQSGINTGINLALSTGSGSQKEMKQMQQLLKDLINVNWFDVAQKFLIAIHGLTHLIRVIGCCARGLYSSIIGSFWNGSFRPRWAYDVQERVDQKDDKHKQSHYHRSGKSPSKIDVQNDSDDKQTLFEEDLWLIALINNVAQFFASFFFCSDENVRCQSGLEGYEQIDCRCDECQNKQSFYNLENQLDKNTLKGIETLDQLEDINSNSYPQLQSKIRLKGIFIPQAQPPLWTFLRWHHLLSIVFPYCTFCPSASILPRNVPTHIIFAARIGHRQMMHQKRTSGHFTNILPVQPVALKKLQKQRLLQLNAQEKTRIAKHELRKAQVKFNVQQKKYDEQKQMLNNQTIQRKDDENTSSEPVQNNGFKNKISKSSKEITQQKIDQLQKQYHEAQQQWDSLMIDQVSSERECVRAYAELVSELQRAAAECICAILESIQSLTSCTLLSANAYSVFMKKIITFTPLQEYISPQAQLLLDSQPSISHAMLQNTPMNFLQRLTREVILCVGHLLYGGSTRWGSADISTQLFCVLHGIGECNCVREWKSPLKREMLIVLNCNASSLLLIPIRIALARRVNMIGILSKRLLAHYLSDSTPIDHAIIEAKLIKSNIANLYVQNASRSGESGLHGRDDSYLTLNKQGLLQSLIPSIRSQTCNFPLLFILSEGGNIKIQSQNEGYDLSALVGNTNFGDTEQSEQDTSGDDQSEEYGEAATGGNWSTYLYKESIDEHLRDSRYNSASVGNDYSTTQGVGPVGQGKPQTLGYNENLIKQQGIKIKDIYSSAYGSYKIFQSPALAKLRFAMARFSLNFDIRIPIIDFSLPPINILQECGGSEVVTTLPNSYYIKYGGMRNRLNKDGEYNNSYPNINYALQNFRLSPFCLPAHMMRLTTIISFGQTKYYPMTPLVSALRYEHQSANLNKEPLQMILQFVKQYGTWTPRQQLMLFSEDYVNIRIKPTIFNTYYTHIPSAQNKQWIKYSLQLPLGHLSSKVPHNIKKRMNTIDGRQEGVITQNQADLLSVFQFLSLSEVLTSQLHNEIVNVLDSSADAQESAAAQIIRKQLMDELAELEQSAGINIGEDMDFNSAND
ncbi:MAG: putative Serine/threonine-protein kinase TIO [Streblomastix strix]|uniref:non-specific serine/threonine protein kinase n=1 Tax=Streblomastix strix TaxID=222440 RepID=A0A5J4X1H4_9EUKA|nr:MAG: putative Serine/threonine-protein kinase TIO [Streblomastix strix]